MSELITYTAHAIEPRPDPDLLIAADVSAEELLQKLGFFRAFHPRRALPVIVFVNAGNQSTVLLDETKAAKKR